MRKYDLEFKMQVINTYYEEELGYKKVADKYGITKTSVRDWVRLHKYHGLEGLKQGYNKQHTEEFKLKLIKEVISGYSIKETCYKNNVSEAKLNKWLKIHELFGEAGIRKNQIGVSMLDMEDYSRLPKELREILEKPDSEKSSKEKDIELEFRRVEVAYLKKLAELRSQKSGATKKKR